MSRSLWPDFAINRTIFVICLTLVRSTIEISPATLEDGEERSVSYRSRKLPLHPGLPLSQITPLTNLV
jgi:hypothetical protein